MKPDLAIFSYVARQVNKQPEELYLIGDSFENDMVGAINTGWHTVWLNKYDITLDHPLKPEVIFPTSEAVLNWVQEKG